MSNIVRLNVNNPVKEVKDELMAAVGGDVIEALRLACELIVDLSQNVSKGFVRDKIYSKKPKDEGELK